jgi:hypothetical protein
MVRCGFFFLWIMAVSCSGCARYWYQEGKTFEQCKQDQSDCLAELKKRSDFRGGSADYEFKFMAECMKQKGYRLVPEGELPLSARRERPDLTLHYRLKGLAGDLPEP